jgi:SpoVK/Ycf46/Vps4 family AAA+-type ATPase
VITFLTTNTLERLDRQDPALLRAGRVDRTFKFSPPGPRELRMMLRSFFPDASEAAQARFVEAVSAREEADARSIATLQELFIYCKMQEGAGGAGGAASSADGVVDMLPRFFEVFFPHRRAKTNLYT